MQNSKASVLDDYEPLDIIGSGSFGQIRKVRRRSDGKLFARKELNFERMSDRDRKQIVAEVNILRGLDHENIVKYEERYVDSENGVLYLVMEFCEGGDLGSIIKRCRKLKTLLPEDTVWAYLFQMTLALDSCHFRGPSPAGAAASIDAQPQATAILHRDLKPENVFLDSDSNIKLGDFGLSKQLAAQSFTQTYVGTPYYMSPELATGSPYDAKSDVWALGCIAYELCALVPPFEASNVMELTRKIKLGHIPQLPRCYSSDLEAVIRKMLDVNPKRRPTTRQMLTHPQLIFAKRTLELSTLSRTLAAEASRLRAQKASLDERESRLSVQPPTISTPSALTPSVGLPDCLSTSATLTDRESRVQQREASLAILEAALEARRAELESRYLTWYHGEREEQLRLLRRVEAERDTLRVAVPTRNTTPAGRMASQDQLDIEIGKKSTRRSSSTAIAASKSADGKAPRVSSSSTNLRSRIISQRVSSVMSAAGSEEPQTSSSSQTTAIPSASVRPRKSNTSANSRSSTVRRYSEIRKNMPSSDGCKALNESNETSPANLNDTQSDSPAPVSLQSSHRRRSSTATAAESSDVSMRPASRMSDFGSCALAQSPASPIIARNFAVPSSSLQGEHRQQDKSQQQQVFSAYDISNDPDLPSPFLRKVNHMPSSALQKAASRNVLARAAIAASAKRSLMPEASHSGSGGFSGSEKVSHTPPTSTSSV